MSNGLHTWSPPPPTPLQSLRPPSFFPRTRVRKAWYAAELASLSCLLALPASFPPRTTSLLFISRWVRLSLSLCDGCASCTLNPRLLLHLTPPSESPLSVTDELLPRARSCRL
ncbi:unnamed protein product, partial [Ectocarpus fasciculatus]